MDFSLQNPKRIFFGLPNEILPPPNLIKNQLDSFNWFLQEGIKEVLKEVSPIEDFTGRNLSLHFGEHFLEEPRYEVQEAKFKGLTYMARLKTKASFEKKSSGEILEQEVFLGDLPLMTKQGTFIINGNERVVVNQLSRSPGVFYTSTVDPSTGRKLFSASLRPTRGSWLEFETDKNGVLTVKIDRRRKIFVTTLLRAFGFESDEELLNLFIDVDGGGDFRFIEFTLEKDPSTKRDEAYLEIYKKMRPGEPAVLENAKVFFENIFLNPRRYSLGKVGRYMLNKKFELDFPNNEDYFILQPEDLLATIKKLIELNNGMGKEDDIDHLANRRVRTTGELVQNEFRRGILRLERIIRERMSVSGEEQTLTPLGLVNARPIVGVLKEFFGSSQLSQFLSQNNPLDQIEHLRRLSVYGPGGLTRERAGFSVRDVHSSYYGRLCPVKAPEGPSIGLLSYLSIYSRLNEFGFLEAPYRKVIRKQGKSFITDEIVYLMADEEEQFHIAEATIKTKNRNEIDEARVVVRYKGEFISVLPEKVDFVDVTPTEVVGISASLIPFISSDAGTRPLMGANMECQAVPLIKTEAPLVGTGTEELVLKNTAQVIIAEKEGEVAYVDADKIVIREAKRKKEYPLFKFQRTNQNTCYNQRPLVFQGEKIKKGQVLADGASSDKGELALGRDLLTAFMPWEGFNWEDSVIISERVVKEDLLTSIHIKEYETSVMDTKLGPEDITRDIPNVSEESLRNLSEEGIVYIGAEVDPGDVLVGKIAPKGETELTAEERLLRAIFGEKAREIRDTSLRMPHGERGTVVDIQTLSRAQKDELSPGVLKLVKVKVAQKRKIAVGDKISGRHGSKGIIAKILPDCDMPYLSDGTQVDIILNPISIVARMNIGQLLETHLGWAGAVLRKKYAVPPYDKYESNFVVEELKKADLPSSGKVFLYDGRTGEPFDQEVTVGFTYTMKLIHLVEDKVHARSTGPYSLITQQPLGGKAQMGGQRLGEMEVWALEAYGAVYNLQEMLTIKSDDVVGRAKAFEAIVKGTEIPEARIPASFKVLVKELNGLCLNIETLGEEELAGLK